MRKNTQANEPSRTVVLLITALVLVGFSGIATFAAAGPSAPASETFSSSSLCPGPTINDVGAAASATYGTTPLNVSFYPVSPGDVFVVSAESEYPTTYTLGDSGDYFTHDTSVAIGYDYWDTWNATTTKSGLVTLTLTPSTSMAATMIAWWVTPLGPVSVSVGTVAQGGSPVSSSAPSAACGLALGDWATLDAVDYVTSPAGWVSGTTSALGFAMDRIGGNWTYVGAGGTITFDPSFSLAAADYNYAQVVTLSPLSSPAPPAQPSVSAIAVSNSEVDLIWNDSSTLVGSDHATLNEYSGASCSGSGTAVNVQTGNWGFQNFTALTPATVYSFNVTITDSDGTSAASACAAATTRAQTLDPFGAVAQGNTTISLPTVAGQRIILLEGLSDALPGDSQGNSWSYVQDGNTGDDALWTAVTATTGTDVITTGTSPYAPYTGGWAVAVSGELKTIVASGQAGCGLHRGPVLGQAPSAGREHGGRVHGGGRRRPK